MIMKANKLFLPLLVVCVAMVMASCESAKTDEAYNGYYIHNASDVAVRAYIKYLIPYRGGNTTTTSPDGETVKTDSIGAQYVDIQAQETKMIQWYWTYGYEGLARTTLPSQNFSEIVILSGKKDTLYVQRPINNKVWELVENRETSMGEIVRYQLTYPVTK